MAATSAKSKTPAKPVDPAVLEALGARIAEAGWEQVESKSCTIVKQNGSTVGYINAGPRKLRVDVPEGGGPLAQVFVATMGDVDKAIKRMAKVGELRAKKAEEKAAAKAAKEAEAAAAEAGETSGAIA